MFNNIKSWLKLFEFPRLFFKETHLEASSTRIHPSKWMDGYESTGSSATMLKYSGIFYEFADMDRDKLLDSIMFADDVTIVENTSHGEIFAPNPSSRGDSPRLTFNRRGLKCLIL